MVREGGEQRDNLHNFEECTGSRFQTRSRQQPLLRTTRRSLLRTTQLSSGLAILELQFWTIYFDGDC